MTASNAEAPYLGTIGEIYWQDAADLVLAPKAKTTTDKPMIAIIIDDVGVDRRHSVWAVEKLPSIVTLSYLAYSSHIQDQVNNAQKYGHEIMLHLPMEPDSETADAGPHHLSIEMTKEQIQKNLDANLNGFTGYTGINNHMGSKFSRYAAGLDIVMEEVKKRARLQNQDIFFLDSRTASDSIVEKTAQNHGLSTTHRDVFLDHEETAKYTAAALKRTEDIARHNGSAIVIGHPKDFTLRAIKAWIPTLESNGFQVVTVGDILKYRSALKTNTIVAESSKPKEGQYFLEKIDTAHP